MADLDLTSLLSEAPDSREAVDRILPLVYPELKALGKRYLQAEREDHTLDTSALVHEAYVRLVGQDGVAWQNRAHFFGIAALAMRRILVDYALARRAEKRGGGVRAVTYYDDAVAREVRTDDLIALDEALTHLATVAERQARVVEMRFFAGLTQPEIAEVLGTSPATVRRDWRIARAWLTRFLDGDSLPE